MRRPHFDSKGSMRCLGRTRGPSISLRTPFPSAASWPASISRLSKHTPHDRARCESLQRDELCDELLLHEPVRLRRIERAEAELGAIDPEASRQVFRRERVQPTALGYGFQ
jgi:hypothetical protein